MQDETCSVWLTTCMWQLLLLLWVWGCHASCFRNHSHDSHTVLRFFFSSSTCFKKRKRKINPQLLINSLVKNVTFPQVSKIRFVALCAPCSNLTALPEIFTYQLSKPWPVLMKCLHWSSSLCTSLHNCTCKLCSALYLPVRQERASVVTQLWHV